MAYCLSLPQPTASRRETLLLFRCRIRRPPGRWQEANVALDLSHCRLPQRPPQATFRFGSLFPHSELHCGNEERQPHSNELAATALADQPCGAERSTIAELLLLLQWLRLKGLRIQAAVLMGHMLYRKRRVLCRRLLLLEWLLHD